MKFFGNENIVEAFRKGIREETLAHAYLLYGEEGIGKATFARYIAHTLEWGESVDSSAPLLDAYELLPEEGKATIGVDAARAIKVFLSEKPLRSPKRTVIIPDAELLTNEAQGALLKIVEEPPASALIFFMAQDPQTLTPPLRSRLQKVYMKKMAKERIAEILTGEYHIDKKEAALRASRSFGRLGEAISKKEKKEVGSENVYSFLEHAIVSLWEKDKRKNAGLLRELLVRESLIKRYNVNINLQKKAIEETMRGVR